MRITGGPREPVFFTLAAVDEGILQLTKFRSPDPVAHYFGRKALGVALHDDYGRLLDPNLGLPAEVRTGGDQLGGEGLTVVPVRSVAWFSGIIEAGRSERRTVRVPLPEFNGEMRLMLVAWSETGLGTAERKMVVRDPAPADLVMPRFLAPGDEAVITASIDNVELGAGEFAARVSATGTVSAADTQLSRRLQTGQRADIPVRVGAEGEGISTLRLTVTGPGNYRTEQSYDIQTRSPYLPETRATTVAMRPGETYTAAASLAEGYVPGSVEVTVGFSPLPLDAGALYASLDRYPYGCTEQITSRAVPLLYSEDLIAMGAPADRGDLTGRMQVAVNTILNRQSADGAFGLWREGDGYASPWLGAYTTEFILRAREAGYAVPQEALTRAYGALRNIAAGEAWRAYGYYTEVYEGAGANDTQQRLMQRSAAYAAYVLARGGQGDIARLRYLHDRELSDIRSPLARAHIGAGLALMGDRARAASAFRAAEEALGYNNTGDYYQTPLRDLAAVTALAAEAGLTDTVERLADRLSRQTPEPAELSTQEKAYLLVALHSLGGGEAGANVTAEGLGRLPAGQRQFIVSGEALERGASFRLGGDTPLFRTVMVTGAPVAPPPAASNRLSIAKTFYSLTGRPVQPDQINQGDRFVIALTVTPGERRVNPVVIADLLPAGFEIESVLRPADAQVEEYDWRTGESVMRQGPFAFLGVLARPQTAQAQDDRFVAAIDVTSEPVTLAYAVRAVTPGSFAIPGAVAEDMYRPEVFARSAPGRVTIQASRGAAGGQ